MPHLVEQNLWEERRKCRTPRGTFHSPLNLAFVERISPLRKKKFGENAFPIRPPGGLTGTASQGMFFGILVLNT